MAVALSTNPEIYSVEGFITDTLDGPLYILRYTHKAWYANEPRFVVSEFTFTDEHMPVDWVIDVYKPQVIDDFDTAGYIVSGSWSPDPNPPPP